MAEAVQTCAHVRAIQQVTPGAEGCEECLAAGETWMHLRLCLTCGHVGCCNESIHKHAQRHFTETGHPVMRSFGSGEDWMWCYVDDMLVQGETARRTDTSVSKEFLRRLSLFSGLADEDLDRLYNMAKPVLISAGTVIMEEGAPGNELYVILDGELEVTKRSGDAEVLLGIRTTGEVVGEMAVLEQAPRSATVRATSDGLLLTVSQTALETLLACSPSATLSILRTMTSRLRSQESLMAQQEKMASLGTLAAGLAHELNNPAAAIQRTVANLSDVLGTWEAVTASLGQIGLEEGRIVVIRSMQEEAASRARGMPALDPLSRSEQEDAIQDWLEDHGVEEAWEVAPVLLGAGWAEVQLDTLSAGFASEQLPAVVRWVAACSSARELLGEIERSSEAISDIVRSVKIYSHLDRAPIQDIDLHDSLESTLVMLKHKLKGGVTVIRDYAPNLPRIEAYGSELNQVWTNLIDNAIDAMEGKGELTIRTRSAGETVSVQLEDTGPGIPEEIQSRIYDAFFTTKPPGVGSGLGLHIVYSIVARKHRGQIRVRSEPGNTCFEVDLPTRLRKK